MPWMPVAVVRKYSLSPHSYATVRSALKKLIKLGHVERKDAGQLYNAHLYRAKPDIFPEDTQLVAMIEAQDMQAVGDYSTAELINKFRFLAKENKQVVKFSASELGFQICSDKHKESIRLKLKKIERLKYIKSRLVGRKYEYELDFGRLMNSHAPEVIEEQGNILADLFRRHSEYHLEVTPSSSTVSRWRQTIKGMLSEGYDYKSICNIIAYLPHMDSTIIKACKSPSYIKRNFVRLCEEAERNLSHRQAKTYLKQLANDMLPPKNPPATATAVTEVMPAASDMPASRKTVYTTEQWKAALDWLAELDKKYIIQKWHSRYCYNAPGIDVDYLRSKAQEYMLKYINGETKSKCKPNSWLLYRLRDHINYKLRAVDKQGNTLMLYEDEDITLEDYSDIMAYKAYMAAKYDEAGDELNAKLRDAVRNAIKSLPEKEQAIVEDYFGFNGKSHIERELGKMHGYSISNISKIITKAKEKLYSILMEQDEIKSYLKTDKGDSPP
jgi:RNA polymerase sigma factor (sigma-70 family)